MESVAEIQDMRVTELKDFLKRNELDVSSIPRADGTDGPPRKSDLLRAALHLRADYENPTDDGPLSPTRKKNVFQSGYSPRSPSVQRTSPRRPAAADANMLPGKQRAGARPARRPSAAADASTPASSSAKSKPRRRSSSWINPAFNLTPGGGTPRRSMTPAKPARRVEVTAREEVFAIDGFQSDGDQLVASDYDSGGGGLSGAESDGGSVVDTDEEDDRMPNRFRDMKVHDIRAWLKKHDVTFNVRSKKAELISLATGHALYLENLEEGTAAKGAAKRDRREADEGKVRGRVREEEDVGEITEVKEERRKTERTPRAAKKGEESVARSREDTAYRRSRTRVIAAPQPDEDIIEKAEKAALAKEDDDDDVVEVKKVKKMKKRQKKERPAKKRAFRSPFKMPSLPKITVTRRGLSVFFGFIFLVLLALFLYNQYEKSTWPYCNTDAKQDIMPDGRECNPCPTHGRCENGMLTCKKGFFQSGKRCVEDQEVSRYAVSVENRLVNFMQQVKGKQMCRKRGTASLGVNELKSLTAPVTSDEWKKKHSRPQNHQFNPEKYDAAFNLAILSLRKNRRNEVTYDSISKVYEAIDGKRELSCIVNQFAMRHIGKILLLLLLSLLFARWRLKKYLREREESRVENVYREAVEVLREVRLNFNDDEQGDAFMIDTQLREEILGRTTDEKVALWTKVEKLLRADSRVFCAGPRSIKGMPCYTYEWRGNLRRPSLSRSASREGFRAYESDSESRRRLSFGAAARRQSGAFEAASPTGGYTPAGSPRLEPVSPGYRNMLNFWNR